MPPNHLEMIVLWSVIEDLILYPGADGSTALSSYCTAAVQKLMGLAVSYLYQISLYVDDNNFLVDTKQKVERMIGNIRRSFHNHKDATWVDLVT